MTAQVFSIFTRGNGFYLANTARIALWLPRCLTFLSLSTFKKQTRPLSANRKFQPSLTKSAQATVLRL